MKESSCILLLSGSFCFASPCFSEQQPSIEFLEFLGEWQNENGKPLDPFDYFKDFDSPQTSKQHNPAEEHDMQQVEDE